MWRVAMGVILATTWLSVASAQTDDPCAEQRATYIEMAKQGSSVVPVDDFVAAANDLLACMGIDPEEQMRELLTPTATAVGP